MIVGYLFVMSLSASLLSMMLIAVNRYILLVKGRAKYTQLYTKPRVAASIIAVSLFVISAVHFAPYLTGLSSMMLI